MPRCIKAAERREPQGRVLPALADHIVGCHPEFRTLSEFALAVSDSFPGVDIDAVHRRTTPAAD